MCFRIIFNSKVEKKGKQPHHKKEEEKKNIIPKSNSFKTTQ